MLLDGSSLKNLVGCRVLCACGVAANSVPERCSCFGESFSPAWRCRDVLERSVIS
jgi:hypothetical protein